MPRNANLTPIQIVEANTWLATQLEVIDAKTATNPGLIRYLNGSGDKDLAKVLGCAHHQAKHIREKLYGQLIQSAPVIRVGRTKELAEVTRKVACLIAELAAKLGENDYAALARRLANEAKEAGE